MSTCSEAKFTHVMQLPRRSISSNASSAGDDVPVMSMAGLLGDVKLKVHLLVFDRHAAVCCAHIKATLRPT